MSHILVLIVSAYILLSSHCPPANTTVELSKEPTRPVEPMIPYSCEKKRVGPTYFASPTIPIRTATPAKLASERRRPVASNSFVSDAPEPEIQEESFSPVVPSSLSEAGSAFPIGIPLRSVAGGGISFAGSASDKGVSVSKHRDPLPICFFEGIQNHDESEPSVENVVANEAPSADDFWKRHNFWGDSKGNLEANQKESVVFIDTHKTNQKPYTSPTTVETWLKLSCQDAVDPEYFSKQHVLSLVSQQMRLSIMRASNDIKIFKPGSTELIAFEAAKNPRKFYWLLLRFVYSSSQMRDPKTESWWYQDVDPTEKVRETAPDNFCLVLQELQKYPDVFDKYSNFHQLIFYYFEGLKSAYPSGGTNDQRKTHINCINWVRSRLLLGVRDAKTKFSELLELLNDNKGPRLMESKHLMLNDDPKPVKAQVRSGTIAVSCLLPQPSRDIFPRAVAAVVPLRAKSHFLSRFVSRWCPVAVSSSTRVQV
jgi:hypothetical protein